MSYNSGVIVLVISNHSPDYSLNCTPLSPMTITININNNNNNNNTNNNNNKRTKLERADASPSAL